MIGGMAGLMMTGCAAIQHTGYHPLAERQFEAREKPARIATESESELVEKGFVLLGMVTVRQEVRACEPTGCPAWEPGRDASDVARVLASEHGGDALLLDWDNVLERVPFREDGKCVKYLIPTLPGGRHECLEYGIVHGIRLFLTSRGTVWRHEPEIEFWKPNKLATRVADEASGLQAGRKKLPTGVVLPE